MEQQTGVTNTTLSPQLRGETMAYAIQNGVYNLAANFFEPYINYRFQRHYASDRAHSGNYTQNLGGELAGDIIGSTTLIAAEAFIPEQLHYFTRSVRRLIDPLYDTVAHYALAKHCKEPDFDKQVQDWKVFQERNLIRSGIMMTSGIASNIATQKYLFKNPSSPLLILEGKLLSSAITTGLGLSGRLAFPEVSKTIDKWMGKKIAPYMEAKTLNGDPSVELQQLDSITPAQPALQR